MWAAYRGLAGLVLLAAPSASFSPAPLISRSAFCGGADALQPRVIRSVTRFATPKQWKMQEEDTERKRLAALEDEVKDNTGAISYVFPRPVMIA